MTLKAANIPRKSDIAQTIASIEADIATIIKRTLGNIPPRKKSSARSREKHATQGRETFERTIFQIELYDHFSDYAALRRHPFKLTAARLPGVIHFDIGSLAESLKNQSEK
ncbi:MAG: hypothetical protein WBE48_26995 [Xanthobacteraceae bacterium]